MGLIHMETDDLYALVTRTKITVDKMFNTSNSLSSRINRLQRSWYGSSADRFVRKANRRLKSIYNSLDQFDTLRSALRIEIEQWVGVDRDTRGIFIPRRIGAITPISDQYIRQVDVDGKEFLLSGLMISAGAGTVSGIGAEGLYGTGSLEIKDRYGELSYDEMLLLAQMYEDGQLPEGWPDVESSKVFNAKTKLWEGDFGTAQAAVVSGQLGSERVGLDYAVLSAEASGSGSLEIDEGALRAGVEGQAGVYLAKVSGNASTAIPLGAATVGLAVAGTAYVGAEICGEAKAVIDLKSGDVAVKAGGEAFAGGKIEGEAEASLGYGGVEGKLKGNASLNYGIGAKAKADVGFDQGTIRADVQIGATLGLGFDVGFSVELDTTEAVNNLIEATQGAVDLII